MTVPGEGGPCASPIPGPGAAPPGEWQLAGLGDSPPWDSIAPPNQAAPHHCGSPYSWSGVPGLPVGDGVKVALRILLQLTQCWTVETPSAPGSCTLALPLSSQRKPLVSVPPSDTQGCVVLPRDEIPSLLGLSMCVPRDGAVGGCLLLSRSLACSGHWLPEQLRRPLCHLLWGVLHDLTAHLAHFSRCAQHRSPAQGLRTPRWRKEAKCQRRGVRTVLGEGRSLMVQSVKLRGTPAHVKCSPELCWMKLVLKRQVFLGVQGCSPCQAWGNAG